MQHVILDFSVIAHQLHENPPPTYVWSSLDTRRSWLRAQAVYTLGLTWLGPEAPPPGDARIYAVHDTKPYWRQEYLDRPEVLLTIPRKRKRDEAARAIALAAPHSVEGMQARVALRVQYKGGRKLPTAELRWIKTNLAKIFEELGVPPIAVRGFEADDLAAYLVKVLPEGDRKLLCTVDSDWLGLLEVPGTEWFCTVGYGRRHRQTLDHLNEWAHGKKDLAAWHETHGRFTSPRQIWDAKAMGGDSSDRLPAGSPLGVIDLLNPAIAVQPNQLPDPIPYGSALPPVAVQKAESWLVMAGCRRAISPYPGPEDKPSLSPV